MKKKIIIATFTLLFVLPFSSELSYSQMNNIQSVNKPIKSVNIHNPPDISLESEKKNNECIEMFATSYTKSVEEGTSKGITKSGVPVSRGIVSVDPKIIPLGTKLYVEGYGYATALDIGGAIKGNKIDLYMNSKKEVFKWGRRNVKVWIIKEKENK